MSKKMCMDLYVDFRADEDALQQMPLHVLQQMFHSFGLCDIRELRTTCKYTAQKIPDVPALYKYIKGWCLPDLNAINHQEHHYLECKTNNGCKIIFPAEADLLLYVLHDDECEAMKLIVEHKMFNSDEITSFDIGRLVQSYEMMDLLYKFKSSKGRSTLGLAIDWQDYCEIITETGGEDFDRLDQVILKYQAEIDGEFSLHEISEDALRHFGDIDRYVRTDQKINSIFWRYLKTDESVFKIANSVQIRSRHSRSLPSIHRLVQLLTIQNCNTVTKQLTEILFSVLHMNDEKYFVSVLNTNFVDHGGKVGDILYKKPSFIRDKVIAVFEKSDMVFVERMDERSCIF